MLLALAAMRRSRFVDLEPRLEALMISARARIALYTMVALLAGTSAGCSVMQASGRWTRESGESMEAYSKSNEGFWASIAGFGGRINKAAGGMMESMAGGGSSAPANAADSPDPAYAAGAPMQANAAQYVAVEPVQTATAMPVAATPADGVAMTARAQSRLLELGYHVGKADGILGPRTKAALQQFQRAKGLAVTGTLDHATLASLGLG